MSFEPRYYQADAQAAIIEHATKSLTSQVCVLPTGAGKSIVIANVAKALHEMSGKCILCTAPNADLVVQNQRKYAAHGYKASIFCASAGRKELRHDVVFGSPLSLINAKDQLSGFSAIIIDECDLITTSIKNLIEHLKADNPKLRVIGLTATPYRMGMGYIYEQHFSDQFIEETYEPYFKKCTYEISAHELINRGFLTKPVLSEKAMHYNTAGMILKSTGKWDQSTVDAAFEGKGRLTSEIVADIVESSRGYNGVIIYASTIQHAEEILESLPPGISGIVHSKCPTRRKTMRDMASQRIKYVVNVDCLTVGIDWPHVDCLAMLRKTESSRLYQQIIGRALRLHPDKTHALILDYAENNEFHFPSGDVFKPKIRAKVKKDSEQVTAICPECHHENTFAARDNDAVYDINESGYFIWSDTGDVVTNGAGAEIPAHFGRRCFGAIGRTERCSYRWTFKECEECKHENDIAARFCESCKAELIDPNNNLRLAQYAEPIQSVVLENEWKGDKRVKVAKITTQFNHRITVFMHVSNEVERNRYRAFRDEDLYGKIVKFCRVKDKGYFKFMSIS